MVTEATIRAAQRSQAPCQEFSEKSRSNGSLSAAKLSTYMKTKDAPWRMLATYPPKMPFTEALLLAKRDFTGTRKGGTPC